jgi:hypothetical protein
MNNIRNGRKIVERERENCGLGWIFVWVSCVLIKRRRARCGKWEASAGRVVCASRSVHFNQPYINADPCCWPSSFMYHPTPNTALFFIFFLLNWIIYTCTLWCISAECIADTTPRHDRPNHERPQALKYVQSPKKIKEGKWKSFFGRVYSINLRVDKSRKIWHQFILWWYSGCVYRFLTGPTRAPSKKRWRLFEPWQP